MLVVIVRRRVDSCWALYRVSLVSEAMVQYSFSTATRTDLRQDSLFGRLRLGIAELGCGECPTPSNSWKVNPDLGRR